MREHAVIGVSPFNSHFSEEKITALIAWAKTNFKNFHLYVPDGPSCYTLEAAGYSAEKAAKKAQRQARWLFNKIRRGLEQSGLDGDAFKHRVLCSATLDHDPGYQRLLAEAKALFTTDSEFRRGCLATSRWVLAGQVDPGDEVTPWMCERAARYFLAELPLFMDSAAIVGAESSCFVYHRCPQFLKRLLAEQRGEIISTRQAFVELTPARQALAKL